MNGAIYVQSSGNTKTGNVDATYASINASCPKTCPLLSNGCYAQTSFVGITTARLNKEAKQLTAIEVAKAEANLIDYSYNGGQVPNGKCLRIHVAGDSKTVTGTRLIAKAVDRWKKRGGKSVWSYTHAWKKVSRKEWGQVAILASVSNVSEAKEAKEKGYACALVVADHTTDKAFKLSGSDIKWIPCPAQTRDVSCLQCKLCFDTDRLYKNNFGIAFAAHGVCKNKIKRHLQILK